MKKGISTLAIALGLLIAYFGVVGCFIVPEIYAFDVKTGFKDVLDSSDLAGIATAIWGSGEEGGLLQSKSEGARKIAAVFDEYRAADLAYDAAKAQYDDLVKQKKALGTGADAGDIDLLIAEARNAVSAADEVLDPYEEEIGVLRLQAFNEVRIASPREKLDHLVHSLRLALLIAGGALVLLGFAMKFALRDRGARAARRAKYAKGVQKAAKQPFSLRRLVRGIYLLVKNNLQKLLAPAALVILYIFFAIFGKDFATAYQFKIILESAYYIGILAFGVGFVIMTGGIDLSIGTNMMCAALLGGYAFGTWGWPLWLAILLVPLIGLFFGVCNGLMVAKLKLPPFIATLGTMLVTQGFGSIVTTVQTQRYPTIGTANEWFKTVYYRAGALPTGVIYLALAFLIALFVMTKTKFGRYTLAIGSNEEAARLSGVKTDNWKILVYAVCGLFAGIAAIFYASTYTTITPGTGNGRELDAIAAVVIGGTSMSGGSGSMVGTIIGVFIMAVLKSGLSSLGLQSQWQTFFTGFVVIGAVLMDIARTNAARRVKKSDSNPAKGRRNK